MFTFVSSILNNEIIKVNLLSFFAIDIPFLFLDLSKKLYTSDNESYIRKFLSKFFKSCKDNF